MRTTKGIINKDAGVTTLTREKHGFDGYAVRKSRHRVQTWRYVPTSPGRVGGTTEAYRREEGLRISRGLYTSVCEIMNAPRSWRSAEGRPALTKAAASRIKDLGFSIKFPA